MPENRIHRLSGLGNLEFLKRYAKPGRVGLFGGSSRVDRAIRVGQRELDGDAKPSLWSHAAVFEGERLDGQSWLIESDFEIGKGQLRNGVQENRIDKYADEKEWPNLGVLDLGLQERDVRRVLVAGLDLVARRTNYDLHGVLETYWAMMRKTLDRGRDKEATFCSAFVRAVFRHGGIDLVPGIAVQHTLPEHVSRTPVPHTRYLLLRDGA
ncbi:MAG TPA: hypothetical protein VG457_14950 [Planctomycetota bacterium]|jgi:hypothetical protein|nr:hypothetical protein [Planctomycetota bacterium]